MDTSILSEFYQTKKKYNKNQKIMWKIQNEVYYNIAKLNQIP